MTRITFLSLLYLIPIFTFAEDKVLHVDAKAAAELIQKSDVTILDVRSPEEFQEGHLKDAMNIDIMSKDFAAKLAELDKTKPLLVHCQAGGRSTRALPTLEKLGFTKVIHMDGGFRDWVKMGGSVVKP